MNDQSVQDPTQQSNSYVDDYAPPTSDANLTDVPIDQVIPRTSGQFDQSFAQGDDTSDQNSASLGDANEAGSDEDIEAQNIFVMLGVDEGDEGLKEKFLDQLQEVIWDDFLKNDVELLLTQDELATFQTYKEKADSSVGEAQEKAKDEMVEFLEKLIPDLEDIMLEKALDLKADLYVERINGMKEYFAEKPELLSQVSLAEQMMFEDKWKSSSAVLNGIKE